MAHSIILELEEAEGRRTKNLRLDSDTQQEWSMDVIMDKNKHVQATVVLQRI